MGGAVRGGGGVGEWDEGVRSVGSKGMWVRK
jgi:hypothetical protein